MLKSRRCEKGRRSRSSGSSGIGGRRETIAGNPFGASKTRELHCFRGLATNAEKRERQHFRRFGAGSGGVNVSAGLSGLDTGDGSGGERSGGRMGYVQ